MYLSSFGKTEKYIMQGKLLRSQKCQKIYVHLEIINMHIDYEMRLIVKKNVFIIQSD